MSERERTWTREREKEGCWEDEKRMRSGERRNAEPQKGEGVRVELDDVQRCSTRLIRERERCKLVAMMRNKVQTARIHDVTDWTSSRGGNFIWSICHLLCILHRGVGGQMKM